jgi:hypothetical protein
MLKMGDVYDTQPEVWIRCGNRAAEVHHMLTRSRGGKILDAAGEIVHLIHLCKNCHARAHGAGGRKLMIDGYVTTGPDGSPVYEGSHPELLERYGKPVDMPDVSEDLSSGLDGQILRGQ